MRLSYLMEANPMTNYLSLNFDQKVTFRGKIKQKTL